MPRYPHSSGVLGFSNFEWDGGNPVRMQALAASVGVDRYIWQRSGTLGPSAQMDQIIGGRRPWPSAESLFLHGDKVVVWLGGTGSRLVSGCYTSADMSSDIGKPLRVNFEDVVNLVGLTVNQLSQCQFRMTFHWQATGELPGRVFVHFTDRDNNILFSKDHPFCNGRSSDELKGKFVIETLLVNIPQTAWGTEIDVKVGLFDPDSGTRLKVISAEGVPLDDGNTRAIVEHIRP
jgi:hypothetical protein